VGEFEASLKKYPPIAPGTRDPYTAKRTSPDRWRGRSHVAEHGRPTWLLPRGALTSVSRPTRSASRWPWLAISHGSW